MDTFTLPDVDIAFTPVNALCVRAFVWVVMIAMPYLKFKHLKQQPILFSNPQ
jgi:hypothetical protein